MNSPEATQVPPAVQNTTGYHNNGEALWHNLDESSWYVRCESVW
jgi:hypothetical protein